MVPPAGKSASNPPFSALTPLTQPEDDDDELLDARETDLRKLPRSMVLTGVLLWLDDAVEAIDGGAYWD